MSSGPIVILCALTSELAHLEQAVDVEESFTLLGRPGWRGSVGDQEVLGVESGMGKVAAAVLVTVLAERVGPRALLVSGVAGGLDPALHVGDVVVATRCIQHDAGVRGRRGFTTYQAGHLPFLDPTDDLGWTPDPRLLATARAAAGAVDLPALPAALGGDGRTPRLVEGTVLTGDQFVDDPATRRRLHADLGAQAVEMEGGAVAQAADALEVPWLVVRAISDRAGEDPDVDLMPLVEHVGGNAARVVAAVLHSLVG